MASIVSSGAMRMPPTAASWVPRIHATRLARIGSAPTRPASARSSTVARISAPVLVRCSSAHRLTAITTATIIVMAWCQVIVASPRRSGAEPEKKAGIDRTTLGFQIHRATAMSPLSIATVTTSRCASPRS